jgi:protein gp37
MYWLPPAPGVEDVVRYLEAPGCDKYQLLTQQNGGPRRWRETTKQTCERIYVVLATRSKVDPRCIFLDEFDNLVKVRHW